MSDHHARIIQSISLLCLLGWLCACSPSSVMEQKTQTQPPAANRLIFDCECLDLAADLSAEEARLKLPDQQLTLPRVPSGSGVKYSQNGYTFWTKGEQARLETPDDVFPNCRIDRRQSIWADAWQRGVSFRAIGQEPGWHLELSPQTILTVLDYGNRTLSFATPAPQPEAQGGGNRYTTSSAGHRLELLIEPQSCQDSMSGEAFANTVTLTIDDRTYRGCGRHADQDSPQ